VDLPGIRANCTARFTHTVLVPTPPLVPKNDEQLASYCRARHFPRMFGVDSDDHRRDFDAVVRFLQKNRGLQNAWPAAGNPDWTPF